MKVERFIMLFSFIIPIYKVEKYLNECVDSILKQEFTDYEIILVDDGSPDGCGIICDEYERKYDFISVIHKENGGLSDARNVGLSAAKGEYILFIDSDDYISGKSLQHIAETIYSNNFPDIVFLEVIKFTEEISLKVAMNDGVDDSVNDLGVPDVYSYLAKLPKYPASACSKAIRRRVLIDNDVYFVKNLLSEDLEWCIRLFLVARTFCYCPHEYYFYRQARTGSISNTASKKKTMDILSTYIKWTEYAQKLNDSPEKNMIASYMEYVFRFLVLFSDAVEPKERSTYIKQIRQGAWVLGTRSDWPSRCIRICYRLFGIKVTKILLEEYLKHR